jgi:UDP-GlcNAc:undecaprenyl-phosphate/decaprenyl-phosphate GlcNAc-1-phosphate transferase
MKQLLWTGLQSFACSLVLTPIIRDIFRSYKVVDAPDQNRKVHKHPIPRVGGIAIALAYLVAYLLLRPFGSEHVVREVSLIENLLPAALIVFITGLVDDFLGLKPWQKLLGQLIAAGVACWAGVVINSVGGMELPIFIGVPVTVFWLLLCSNAVNLVDGLDGLAAGVGFFATMTMFAGALVHGNEPLAFATIPLAGALLGFLCFNFNPATVFLGDGGSLLIGFLLGSYGIIWTQKSVTLLGITAPVMTLCIPLLDVLLAITRRWLRNQPVFSADRGHIHHRLLDRGLTTRQTVLLLYGFCGLCAVFSITQSLVNDIRLSALVVFAFVATAWMGVHYLGYTEFILAGRLLRAGEFQRSVMARLNLNLLESKLAAASTVEECCQAAIGLRRTFGFAGIRIHAGRQTYEEWDTGAAGPGYWLMQIPLTSTDYVEVTRTTGCPIMTGAVLPFVELLSAALTEKLTTEAAADASPAGANPAATLAMQSGQSGT